ncbi:unnamed protein product [Effrenium voratum]|nr:unnamed protein product [Effrenium voratum]
MNGQLAGAAVAEVWGGEVAQEIDGASAAHVKASRAFVSQLILEAQRKGLQQEKDKDQLLVLDSEPPGIQAECLLTVCLAPLNCRAMSDRVPLDWADKELRSYMYREGLASLFAPCDAQALDELLRHLACDSYGGVAAVRYARDAYNARHPMHLMLDVPEMGQLWLGGELAVKDTNLLLHNRIQAVWPACKAVEPHDTVAVRILPFLDGTAVANKDVRFSEVVDQVDRVISLLKNGMRVAVVCRNGAHRSATLVCLILMRLSGASAQEVSNHVSQPRNIVDLCSRAPANARRLSSARPIDYLSSVERLLAAEWVGIGSEVFVSSRYCSPLLTPQRLRHKALQLGFVTEDPKAPAPKRLRTMLLGRNEASGTCTLSSSGSSSAAGSAQVQAKPWVPSLDLEGHTTDSFEVLGSGRSVHTDTEFEKVDRNPESPCATPRANWTRADFQRLSGMMHDLSRMNAQLMAFTSGFSEAEGEAPEAEAEDAVEKLHGEGAKEPLQGAPSEDAAAAGDESVGGKIENACAWAGAIPVKEEVDYSDDDDGEPKEESHEESHAAAAVSDLVKNTPGDSRDEALTRLYELLETQKVQQQAVLSSLQTRQERELFQQSMLSALLNRDSETSVQLICKASPAQLMMARDEAGLTVVHHAVRLGLGQVLEAALRKAPLLADAVTFPSSKPDNWTPLMVLCDAAPGSLGGLDHAYEMLKYLLCFMSATGMQILSSTRAGSGMTAFHLAAARGQFRFVKKLVWSLYHKAGGNSSDRSDAAFSLVTSVVNSKGGKRAAGCVDLALGSNLEVASYLKCNWGGTEQLENPRQWRRGQAAWSGASFSQRGN